QALRRSRRKPRAAAPCRTCTAAPCRSPWTQKSRKRVFPKEHGAYGQLLFPLATVLVVGRRTPAALTLAAAAVLAFLAHEPLLVLLGHRGPRAARDDRSRALVWLASTALGAAILGAAAFIDAPAGIHLAPAAAVPAAPSARRLRAIGWTLLATMLLGAALLVAAFG